MSRILYAVSYYFIIIISNKTAAEAAHHNDFRTATAIAAYYIYVYIPTYFRCNVFPCIYTPSRNLENTCEHCTLIIVWRACGV